MLRKVQYKLILFWFSFFFIIPLPFIQSLSSGLKEVPANESIAIYCGAISYAWMLAAVYLSTKPHWLDRLVGLPSLYQLHGILAIAALGLAWLHKIWSPSSGLIKQTGNFALVILTGVIGYSLLFLANWLSYRLCFLEKFKKSWERIFKHEFSIWLHRLLLVSVCLVFVHVQLIDYIRTITPFMFWFDSFSLLTAIAYCQTKINWFGKKNYARIKLIKWQQLSERVYELILGGHQTEKLTLRAGDFVFLSFPTKAKMHEPHPFSLVSLPDSHGNFKLTIRADGDFTSQLQELSPGTPAIVSGGYGRYQPFIDEHRQTKYLVIITGGIGATPLFSLIPQNLSHQIFLFYSAHRQSELLYQEQLIKWNQQPNFSGFWQQGRFADNFVLEHLPNDWQNDAIFLLSGPLPLIHHWERILLKAKIRSQDIFKEEFSW